MLSGNRHAASLGDALSWNHARATGGTAREPVDLVAWLADRDKVEGQDQSVEVAAGAALLRLERAGLEADLQASTADLEASRARLLESAYAERQRIERDLHDSVQQDLLGVRLKLAMAAERLHSDPDRALALIGALGDDIDQLLGALRSVAQGIYPSLLDQRGLAEALKSTARRSPIHVTVTALDLSRYSREIEIAGYYCCLEALQNVVKHAGREATAAIRIWREPRGLCLQVRDSGPGFDPQSVPERRGLLNMQDRIEAVGGRLTVTSRRGRGTVVVACVPIPEPGLPGSRTPPAGS